MSRQRTQFVYHCLVLSIIALSWPALCRAEIDNLSITTMEYTADVERLRGLKLKRPITTIKLPWTSISPELRERHPLSPTKGFQEDLLLYQNLGLLPEGAAGNKTTQIRWPYFPAAYFSDRGEGSGPVIAVSTENRRPTKEAHIIAVGLAVLAQHHDLDDISELGNRDRQLARSSLLLGDATLTWLSRKGRPPVDEVDDHIRWAQRHLKELFKRTGKNRGPKTFADRLIEARYLEGLRAIISLRSTSPWPVVDELYRRGVPRSTAQLLHPNLLVEDRQNRTIERSPLIALSAYGQPTSGVLGELRLRLWLETHIDQEVARRAMEGWAGDEFLLYPGVQGGNSILLLLTVWDGRAEPAEVEAADFAGAAEIAFIRRFEGPKQPLVGAPTLSAWLDSSGGATYVEQQGDRVLILSHCPQELVAQVKDQVWSTWQVGRPDLGVVGEIRPSPPEPVAPLPPPIPWYRRIPGLVALGLWLLVVLPLLSYFGTRGQKTSPISVYLFGLFATIGLIVAGWLFGL